MPDKTKLDDFGQVPQPAAAQLTRPSAQELTGADADALQDRRNFLTRSASMLGLVLSGGALMTFLNSCETDETREPGITGGGTGPDPDPDPDPDPGIDVNITVPEEVKLAAVGGSLQRSFGTLNGGMPVIIIRTEENVFKAYTSECTHSGCPVEEDLDGGLIWCACHDSYFDPATGARVDGPAVLPLKEYPTKFDSDTQILTITF